MYRHIASSHTAQVIKTPLTNSDTEITIPPSVEIDGEMYTVNVIADSAFMNCSELESVTLPASVMRIGARAFKDCASLKSINLKQVGNIGARAFVNCSGLKEIELSKITYLGYGAFEECKGIKSISIDNLNPPALSSFVFQSVSAREIQVPCNAVEAYKKADNWNSLYKVFSPLPIKTELNVTIFNGETYKENGFNESREGYYRQQLESANNCDSIVTLHLTVIEKPATGLLGNVYGTTVSDTLISSLDDLKGLLSGNTIVSFNEKVPTQWSELPNVVVNGTARNIKLSSKGGPYTYDGEISADSAEFKLYYKTTNYETDYARYLAIPFSGTANTDGCNALDIVRYTVLEFKGSKDSELVFRTLENSAFTEFKENVPYLITFGDIYLKGEGPSEDFLSISAANTIVQSSASVTTPGGKYDMKSIYNGKTEANSYNLPETFFWGRLTLNADPMDADPFSVYAVAGTGDPTVDELYIAIDNRTDLEALLSATLTVYAENGDIVIRANKVGTTSIYNINGQMVNASVIYGEGETRVSGLNAGTYIVAGKKVVLK